MGKPVRLQLEYDQDTANYHRFKMPDTKLLFSKNYAYAPKDEDVPSDVSFIFGTLADNKKVTKLRRAK